MSLKSPYRKLALSVAGIAAAAGLAFAFGLGPGASGQTGDPSQLRADKSQATTSWPKNAAGLTYGSAGEAKSPADEPDLILAYATNGKLGYVKRTDLEPASPSSPQQAVAQQMARADILSQQIPVYAVDGVTQIGVFIIDYNLAGIEESAADM